MGVFRCGGRSQAFAGFYFLVYRILGICGGTGEYYDGRYFQLLVVNFVVVISVVAIVIIVVAVGVAAACLAVTKACMCLCGARVWQRIYIAKMRKLWRNHIPMEADICYRMRSRRKHSFGNSFCPIFGFILLELSTNATD